MKNLLFLATVLAAYHIGHSTPDYCRKQSDQGRGMNFTFNVFYDHYTDQCKPFFYTGKGGNNNRFANERDCLRTCSPNAENTYPLDVRKICRLKPTTGECSGNFLRFYYDSVDGKCKKFLWTGCIGNGNRFFDAESCNATCARIHDRGEEDKPDTPNWSAEKMMLEIINFSSSYKSSVKLLRNHLAVIICGTLLTIIILAVVVFTIKSK